MNNIATAEILRVIARALDRHADLIDGPEIPVDLPDDSLSQESKSKSLPQQQSFDAAIYSKKIQTIIQHSSHPATIQFAKAMGSFIDRCGYLTVKQANAIDHTMAAQGLTGISI